MPAIRHNPRHLYAERRAADHSANIGSSVAVVFGKWPIAGLRRAGTTAPALFEGAINGEMFPLPGMATEQSR